MFFFALSFCVHSWCLELCVCVVWIRLPTRCARRQIVARAFASLIHHEITCFCKEDHHSQKRLWLWACCFAHNCLSSKEPRGAETGKLYSLIMSFSWFSCGFCAIYLYFVCGWGLGMKRKWEKLTCRSPTCTRVLKNGFPWKWTQSSVVPSLEFDHLRKCIYVLCMHFGATGKLFIKAKLKKVDCRVGKSDGRW